MKIDIYASAQTVGSKDDRRTACALILVATSPDGRVQVRKMGFPLGTATINLAGLQAIKLAVMSLRSWVGQRRIAVGVQTDNHYALTMLAKDGDVYKSDPKTNIDVVVTMREQVDKFPGLALSHQKLDGGIGNACLVLAREVAASQSIVDGGTKEFKNGREAGLGN